MARTLFALLVLLATPARALDCRTAARDNQLHARNIMHSLRSLDALTQTVRRLEAHSEAVFIDLEDAVRGTDYNPIGLNIEQSAALTMHRGAVMRAASDQRAAVGGEYLIDFEMRTPYVTLGFDFGLAFNRPERLDLFPGLGNSLSLIVAMGLGSHF